MTNSPPPQRWLDAFGDPDWISFVPGNHDTYVRMDWQHGLSHLAAYMQGDMRVELTQSSPQIATPFPYVRLRRNVALIGSRRPCRNPCTGPRACWADTQLEFARLPAVATCASAAMHAIVMIHHPPLPGLAKPRKALLDAPALRDVLEEQGAELVLHGHNHEHMLNTLNSRFGTVHVLGVPSASLIESKHHPLAAWNLYRIQRQGGKWLTR